MSDNFGLPVPASEVAANEITRILTDGARQLDDLAMARGRVDGTVDRLILEAAERGLKEENLIALYGIIRKARTNMATRVLQAAVFATVAKNAGTAGTGAGIGTGLNGTTGNDPDMDKKLQGLQELERAERQGFGQRLADAEMPEETHPR